MTYLSCLRVCLYVNPFIFVWLIAPQYYFVLL
nr:MAG TPA_asm: hypothetical protein [Caudoviricetes sp.]